LKTWRGLPVPYFRRQFFKTAKGEEMQKKNSDATEEKHDTPKVLVKRLFGFYEIVLIILILLSIVGVGITDFSPGGSHIYWLVMVLNPRMGTRPRQRQKVDNDSSKTISALARPPGGCSAGISAIAQRTLGR
jgi:hypothetical protein